MSDISFYIILLTITLFYAWWWSEISKAIREDKNPKREEG